jgi:hypothetical protein
MEKNTMKFNWVTVHKDGLPNEDRPFVVFCRALHTDIEKCITMGVLTTHNRGIGIRPAGERNYHLDKHVTMWAYIPFPWELEKEPNWTRSDLLG